MEEVTFQLEQFDFKGPLDLLLTLIQKNKINITITALFPHRI